jgi:hypothetical protein
MGYKVCKFQNAPSNENPTLIISENDRGWRKAYARWLQGKNPTKDDGWGSVIAITRSKEILDMTWKEWLVYKITMLCLWTIGKLNKYKDRGLSQSLFDLAEDYNTRPGTFNYSIEEAK